jgi:thiol-disulfide isomerase/thioredoxin
LGLAVGFALQACSTRSSFAQIAWERTLEGAKAKAEAGNKLIIADMFADWCGWCKKMDVQTWAVPQVIQLQNKYVFLKLDAEKEADGITLRKKFSITGFPTVMLLNADASEFDRLEGFLPAQQFLDRLNGIMSDPDSLGNLKIAERRNPKDLALRSKLARMLFENSDYAEARLRYEEIAKQDPANKSGLKPTALFYLALCLVSEDQGERALSTIDQLKKQYPASEKIAEASLLSGEILFNLGRRGEAKVRIQEFLKNYPNHRLVPQAKRLLSEL